MTVRDCEIERVPLTPNPSPARGEGRRFVARRLPV